MTIVRLLAAADAEVSEAAAYFDDQRNGLGKRFERDLLDTLELLREHPLAGKAVTKQSRSLRLRRFKYNIVYVLDGDEIIVVAVAHHRRRPGYWRRRLATIR